MSAEVTLTEHTLDVAGGALTLLVNEPHLRAHQGDLQIDLPRLLDLAAAAIAGPEAAGAEASGLVWLRSNDLEGGRVERWVEAPEIVGLTGLVPAGPDAFWGYRRGREIPSHLVVGEKQPTRQLTLFGERLAPDRVHIYTIYPGDPAPREIHDPRIPLDALDEAIAFWSRHALVVREGEYTLERQAEDAQGPA